MMAIISDNPAIALNLIASSADVNTHTKRGFFPLMATDRLEEVDWKEGTVNSANHRKVVRAMLNAGANVNAVAVTGFTAVFMAASGLDPATAHGTIMALHDLRAEHST